MPNPTRSRATVVQMVLNPGGRGALLEVRARRRTATGNGVLAPGVKSTPRIARCVVPSHAAVGTGCASPRTRRRAARGRPRDNGSSRNG